MKRKLLLLTWLFFHGSILWAQSPICATSDPFCTSNVYTFPAGVNSGTAESGANYGCLTTRPNPAWYHMRILTPGFLQIYMFSTPLRDIDFICWGPFDDPVTPCVAQLTSNKIIDCSYSPNPTEYVDIPNAIQGKYYILLITNYSNQPCNITFQKSAGVGETDCSILPPPVSSNSPVCVTQQIELYADLVTNATYSWTGPSGFSSNLRNPIIPNAQLTNAGDYTLIINVNGNLSEPAVTAVEVFPMPVPNFSFNVACHGETTQFTDLSATLPAGQQITSWEWNFGDGATSPDQNPQHLYAAPGVYTVTLTTYTGTMMCPQSKVMQVQVNQTTFAQAGDDITIPNGWMTQLNGGVSQGSGNFSVLWQPQSLVVNPTWLNTQTVNLTSTTVFTLNITDQASNCVSSDQVTVNITGGVFSLAVSASPQAVCEGQPTQLIAYASGGSGNFTFSWTSDPPGFFSSDSQPFVTPLVTTTYFSTVFDGQNYLTDQVTVTVHPVPWADAGPDFVIPTGWTTQLEGTILGNSTNYSLLWQPQNLLVDPTAEDPMTLPMATTTTFTLTATDSPSGCSSSDQTIVYVSGGALGVMAIANLSAICAGQQVQLDANPFGGSGNYTYLWTSVPPGFTSTIKNPLVTPVVTTTYFVEVNDGQNSAIDDVLVTVNPSPLVNTGENIVIPGGWTAQLHAQVSGGSGNYHFAWQPAAFLNNPSIPDPATVPLYETKTFVLTVTDNVHQCIGNDDVMVIVSGGPLGVELSVSSQEICHGEQIDLLASASGGSGIYQYSWSSDPAGFVTNIPNPSDFPEGNTTYHVTVSDGANQVNASVAVVVKLRPVALAGMDQVINSGTNTLLTGAASGGSGSYGYQWQPADKVESPNQAVTKTHILSGPEVFSLSVTDQNGCVSAGDDVLINATGDGLAVFAMASPSAICLGESAQISAVATGGGTSYSYLWTSQPPGFTSTQSSFVEYPAETTRYFVTVDDGFNQVTNTVDVTVNPLPFVDLVPPNTILYGQDTIIVCVRDTLSLIARHESHPEGTQYFWSNFYAGDRMSISTNGNWFDQQSYWVRITFPQTGCNKIYNITVLFDFNQCNIGLDEYNGRFGSLIVVYPNPSHGEFNVSTKADVTINSLAVYDMSGKPVFLDMNRQVLSAHSPMRINLSGFSEGMYMVLIQSKGEVFYQRIILR